MIKSTIAHYQLGEKIGEGSWTQVLAAREAPSSESRQALEGYKSGALTAYQVQQMLGFQTRIEVDGFLKSHWVWLEYSLEDLERDRAALDALLGE